MIFSESLKSARVSANLTQKQLAVAVGMTERTIQNYETGNRKPQKYEVIEKLSAALGVEPSFLTDNQDLLILDAQERGGAKAARDVESIVKELSALFAGGSLDDTQKDGVMKAIQQAYWDAKEDNKKYTPKKYRK